jgi:diguanylate cyclase (GGDEF)-like protein
MQFDWFNLSPPQVLWVMVALHLGIYAGIWFVASRLKTPMAQAMRLMAAFNTVLALSLLLVALRGHVPDALTRVPANLLSLLAFVALWCGGLRLLGVQPPRKEPLVLLAVGSLLIVGLGLNPAWGNQRVAAGFFVLVWLILRAWFLVRKPLGRRHAGLASGALTLAAWLVAGVLFAKAVGGLWWNWPIELDREQAGSLLLPYLVLAMGTLVNSVLAYVVVHNTVMQLEELNRRDTLTGLPNRRAFIEALGRCWAHWQRDRAGFAVVCVDVDRFKAVNDTFGHQAGDAVLQQVAQAMAGQVRPTDVLARTGGEEFVLLVTDLTRSHLLVLAERLRQTVADSVTTPDGLPVHVSLGVAHSLPPDERADTVVSRADVALYTAKAQGRNRVCLSQELAQVMITSPPAQAPSPPQSA